MRIRKKILQLLHGLNTGGAEILAERLGRRLAESYDVIFACLDNVGEIGERLLDSGFQVTHLARGSGIDFGCARRLATLVRKERVDIIHAHQYTPFFYALTIRMLATGRPVLFTEHGRFLPDYPRKKRMLFNRAMLRRQDRLIAVGRDVKRALVENEGLPADRVEVIYNGVCVESFDRAHFPHARQWLLADVGLPSNAVIVVQVARLDYLKDHRTAVRTIAATPEAANVHLLVIGEGPERAAIESEIQTCALSARVHLLGLRHDIARILAGADILLLTSISEGIPLTIIEGMAAGLPIVSTDVGGISEIIEDQLHGFLSPAKDVAALSSGLMRLGQNSTLRQRMGEAGCQAAALRFSEQAMHTHYHRTLATMSGSLPQAKQRVNP